MLAPRNYQRRALDAIAQAEREGVRRPLVVHPTGTGKGHPLGTDIMTPDGWRKWGDLEPGDKVFGSLGLPIQVSAVFDRGVLPTYRVTFSDQASIEVDADHLWTVQDYRYRRTAQEWRTLPTSEIAAEGLTFGASRRWSVPLAQMLFYSTSPYLPIDPYTLGSLIANGSMIGSSTQLTTPDEEVVARIKAADRHDIRRGKLTYEDQCPRFSLPGLAPFIRNLGLNVHSRDKFIPEIYLLAAHYDRLNLLQGLMDGDGSSRDGRRAAYYFTTSPRLAADVRSLVMSLGGTATISTAIRQRDGGEYPDITVNVLLPSGMEAFSTSRKRPTTFPRRTFEPRRRIVDIERVADQEIRCITVDAPDRLYVVGRDFVVTHNTVTFGHLLNERADRGRGLVLVHREELAEQAEAKLRMIAPELRTGIVKATRNELDADVVIASVPTVQGDARLAELVASGAASPFATVVADEAHHAPAPSWTKVLHGMGAWNAYGPLTVGFTATPERDAKTLGVWERVVAYMSIREAIYGNGEKGEDGHHGGFLVPILPAVVVETQMDMTYVRRTGGDFSEGDLGRQMELSGAIDQIADAYVQHAADRKAVAFTPTIETAHQLAGALRQRGVPAAALSGKTKTEDRKDILARLKSGALQVVSNCAVLTEGFDEPSISCVIVARPTKFHGLYVQMVGRGTRLHPGKKDLMVLDIVGASNRHELVGVVDLGLDLDTRGKKKDGEIVPLECRVCESAECADPQMHRCHLCHRYLPAALIEHGDTRHENCQSGSSGKVDVFGNSRLRWLPLPSDGWCLGSENEVVVMAPSGVDVWKLAVYRPGDPKVEVLHEQIPSDWAMGIGEDRVKAFQKLAERSARWLAHPASSAQKSRLLREGLPEKVLNRVKTKGDAADLLNRIYGRRALKKMGLLV
jgi:superfamily II DNA or RNA helicase